MIYKMMYIKKSIRNTIKGLSSKDFNYDGFRRYYFDFIVANKEKIPCYNILSKRQREILMYKMAGYKNVEIAKKLNVKGRTIKWHFSYSCSMLNVHFFKRMFLGFQSHKVIFIHLFYQTLLHNQKMFDQTLLNKEKMLNELLLKKNEKPVLPVGTNTSGV